MHRNYGWFAFHIKFKGCALSSGMRISARSAGFDVSCQLPWVSLDAPRVTMLSCLPHLLWLAVCKAASFPKAQSVLLVLNSPQMSWLSTEASSVAAEFLFSVFFFFLCQCSDTCYVPSFQPCISMGYAASAQLWSSTG